MRVSSFLKTYCVLIVLCLLFSTCGDGGPRRTSVRLENDSTVQVTNFCTVFPDSKTPVPGWSAANTVVVQWLGDPDMLHPTNGLSTARINVFSLIHRALVGYNMEDLSIVPLLVKSLPELSSDSISYTYELRDDVRWDDGSPLTIEDVLFTFKAAKCPLTENPQAKTTLQNLKDIEVDKQNPRKFTLHMTRRYIQNIDFLTDFYIIQRKFFDPANILSHYSIPQFDSPTFKPDKLLQNWSVEFNSGENGNNIDRLKGLGPYTIVSWERGNKIVLEKKKNHWTQKIKNPGKAEVAYPDKIIFKVNTDNNSVKLEVKSQMIDLTNNISTTNFLELRDDPEVKKNYHCAFIYGFDYGYIAFNMKSDGQKHKKLFTDKKVRRAIALATPVDEIASNIYKGNVKRLASMVPFNTPGYNAELKLLPLDLSTASRLLSEAGWKDTDGDNILDKMIDGEKVKFEFKLCYARAGKVIDDLVQNIAESYNKIGVKMEPDPIEHGLYLSRCSSHDFDMALGVWTTIAVNDDYTQVWHTSSWGNGGGNYSGFGNASSDALIDSLKYTLDNAKRLPMQKRLQAIVYDEQPFVFLYTVPRKVLIHKRFGNAKAYGHHHLLMPSELKLLFGNSSSHSAAGPVQ